MVASSNGDGSVPNGYYADDVAVLRFNQAFLQDCSRHFFSQTLNY